MIDLLSIDHQRWNKSQNIIPYSVDEEAAFQTGLGYLLGRLPGDGGQHQTDSPDLLHAVQLQEFGAKILSLLRRVLSKTLVFDGFEASRSERDL